MKFRFALGIAVALSLLPRNAGAALVLVDFSARVTELVDPEGALAGIVNVDDPITGTYSYETGAVDSSPDPRIGEYLFSSPPAFLAMTVGGLTFQSDVSSLDVRASVFNDLFLFGDFFFVQSFNNVLPGSTTRVLLLSFGLQDPTGTAVSSDQLLAGAPNLTRWASRELSIIAEPDPLTRYIISGEITTITPRSIPEPAGLLVAGLVAVGTVRRWQARRNRRRPTS